jgi:hypothetical protein
MHLGCFSTKGNNSVFSTLTYIFFFQEIIEWCYLYHLMHISKKVKYSKIQCASSLIHIYVGKKTRKLYKYNKVDRTLSLTLSNEMFLAWQLGGVLHVFYNLLCTRNSVEDFCPWSNKKSSKSLSSTKRHLMNVYTNILLFLIVLIKLTVQSFSGNVNLMGFIIAVTALTPEVGGASKDWDLSCSWNSITNIEYTETYDSYSIFRLSFHRLDHVSNKIKVWFLWFCPNMYKCTFW